MGGRSHIFLLILPSVVMAIAVPALTLYYVAHGLELIAGTVIIVFGIIGATVLGIVGIGVSSEIHFTDTNTESQSLHILRSAERTMLEEFDDIISLLDEIKDTLSSGDDR
ncbi:MAG: hypothetical protein KIY12_05840 [Thermoplasmata archaeon]|uniref:Uncharacterized protein n=1 Tax=Candidatus Sysuiplasma superficiale TaxID=2823368 RepID=A0A8J8CDN3_9ARCH|nr:hypothetical protein [Candidatus Sysuiplasma superficiale]MBX8644227.1 hypothetical protein [Candidatus Sysuiplasma superficiale]MCL4346369.1 hypothetical protein [Candidatus Thermoplasmatota archaeon]